jgi:hypothetical protein
MVMSCPSGGRQIASSAVLSMSSCSRSARRTQSWKAALNSSSLIFRRPIDLPFTSLQRSPNMNGKPFPREPNSPQKWSLKVAFRRSGTLG